MEDINFKPEEPNGFYHTLVTRVGEYFDSNNLSRKSNAYGRFKVFLFLCIYATLLVAIYMADGNVVQLLTAFTVLGFIQICCALIMGHEGVHGSFSKNKKVNKALSYAFDMVGTSGYLWGLRHVHSHHPYPMIPEHDVDIQQQSGLIVFHPQEEPAPGLKYQYLYAPFLYIFYTLMVVFKRDYLDFISNKIGNKVINHKRKEYIELGVMKTLYFVHVLILPLVLSGVHWGWVLLGFVIMHFVESLTAATALFPAHLYEESIFPRPDKERKMERTWAEHQIAVTMDFGTRWQIVGFFFGGINYHMVHHLFPMVSHVHFHTIQKILIQTCKDFGLHYNHEPHLHRAILSHFKLLRRNGLSRTAVHHMAEVI
ncbi:MAG: hypothetical protein COB05_09295 [Marinobacter sp.]|nr:MAG: hypothetical protein COB05_09295 [Marinobacter sp.]